MLKALAGRVSRAELIAAVVVGGVLALGFATGRSVCLWQAAFGVPCPGCGMSRALLALARGHIAEAWQLNHMSLVAAPILVGAAIRRAVPQRFSQRFPKQFNGQ